MSNKVYEQVTKRIIEALESGVVPWRRPWRTGESLPVNAITKKPYRGVNVFLWALAPYQDHRWMTFRQALELGGNVRKGEKSSMVVFWKVWKEEATDEETGELMKWRMPILRYYHVFNAEQCENLKLPELPSATEGPELERIERAEAVIRSMPNPPKIAEGGKSAWYKPADDQVQMPPLKSFETADSYYATFLHELAHSTGHESRLNRSGVTGEILFGSEDYSREELVAELASAFCSAEIGLDNSLLEDSASYISGWLRSLRTDPRAMVLAASQAQKAADYIRGIQPETL